MPKAASPEVIKLVVIGDGAVGKTSLLMAYAQKPFSDEYVPTVFDNYSTDLTVNEKPITFTLWDTAGQEEYDRLRVMSYPGTNVILMCFSTENKVSHTNIKQKWLAEVREHCPGVPIILAGTKVDLRTDTEYLTRKKATPISQAEGQALASEIGAKYYIECSSKTREGVKNVFDSAIKAVLLAKQGAESGGCSCQLL